MEDGRNIDAGRDRQRQRTPQPRIDFHQVNRAVIGTTPFDHRHAPPVQGIGTIFSRASGNRRFVEIELGFAGDQTLAHLQTLSRLMEDDLAAEIPGLSFKIFPMVDRPPGPKE